MRESDLVFRCLSTIEAPIRHEIPTRRVTEIAAERQNAGLRPIIPPIWRSGSTAAEVGKR